MRKLFLIFIILIIGCANSDEETTTIQDTTTTTTTTTIQDTTTTTIQETTTTTIPPVPTSDTNYVELYNTKLGTELCSDAKEIDTTSEECLRQYRDNLENVFSYAKNLTKYVSELNKYFELYPSEMTEEYKNFYKIFNEGYQFVPETYGIVSSKYIERFGGVPVINAINIFNSDNLEIGCSCEGEVVFSENLRSAEITYLNNANQEITIYVDHKKRTFNHLINSSGGEYKLSNIKAINFLGELYNLSFDSNFFVKSYIPDNFTVYLSNTTPRIGEEIEFIVKYDPGYIYKNPTYVRAHFNNKPDGSGERLYNIMSIFKLQNLDLELQMAGRLDKNNNTATISMQITDDYSLQNTFSCIQNCDQYYDKQVIQNHIQPHSLHKELFLAYFEIGFSSNNPNETTNIGYWIQEGTSNYTYYGPCSEIITSRVINLFNNSLTIQQ